MFAARPKLGKSWMALNIAVCITHGIKVFNTMEAEKGDVLYLSLEDTERRLKARYEQMVGKLHLDDAAHLVLQPNSRRLNEGGATDIAEWIDEADNPRLVIVDTLGKVRPSRSGSEDAYDATYSDLTILKSVADAVGIGMLVIHHTRKTAAEDALEEVLGSTGFTGAADSIFVLKRKRGDNEAVLLATGRDIEECSMHLAFDPEDGFWKQIGDGKENYGSTAPSRDGLLDWCITLEQTEFTPSDASTALGMGKDAARMSMNRLAREGKLRKVRTGVFRVPTFIEEEGELDLSE